MLSPATVADFCVRSGGERAKMDDHRIKTQLLTENAALRQRLAAAEATIDALRSGAGAKQMMGGADVAHDVTPQRQTEAALRESEERFRGAFDFAVVGMALVAPDGRFLRVNRALCDMVGYAEDELMATNFQAITHPDDLEADLAHMHRLLGR